MTHTPRSDPFEDEIREALVREATEPAPERLVARVAVSRRDMEPGRGWMSRLRARLGAGAGAAPQLGFGLVAVAAVLLVGALLVRGTGPGPSVAGQTPSGVASVQPSGAPSAAPSAVPPSPSPGESAGPLKSQMSGPAGGPIPAGFQPKSVTFVSADEGWILGSATCSGKPCAAIVRTTDGGRTWASIPAPKATIVSAPQGGTGTADVSGLRFADARDGWAFGPDLWETHDGGSTWHKVTLPGATADTQIWALEASAGSVQAAIVGIGGGIGIATSSVANEAWSVSPTSIAFGAGPVPSAQLVLHGTTGWLIEVDRAVVGGARLANGAWTPWQPPCLDAAGPATLAATTAADLVAACDVGLWSTPTGVHLYLSSNTGSSFAEAASKVPVFDIQAVAAAAPSTTIVGGSLSGVGSALVASFDGGRTWSAVHVLQGAGSFSELGFTTDAQGVAIATPATGNAELLMTRDGGHTWTPVAIAGP